MLKLAGRELQIAGLQTMLGDPGGDLVQELGRESEGASFVVLWVGLGEHPLVDGRILPGDFDDGLLLRQLPGFFVHLPELGESLLIRDPYFGQRRSGTAGFRRIRRVIFWSSNMTGNGPETFRYS